MRKFYEKFFYVPKHMRVPETVFNTRMAVSAVTILACCALFCSATLAYFSASNSSAVETVKSAEYSFTVRIDGEAEPLGTSGSAYYAYTCPVAFNNEHKFVLERCGSAKTGYCEIKIGEISYGAIELPETGICVLTVKAAKGCKIEFHSSWGTPSIGQTLLNSETPLEISENSFVYYVIEEGVTIEQLSEHYGVPAEDILIFNNVTELPAVGVQIMIPNTAVTAPFVLTNSAPVVSGELGSDEPTTGEPGSDEPTDEPGSDEPTTGEPGSDEPTDEPKDLVEIP